MTLAEQILAAHCGRATVKPGDLVNVKVDVVMANDVTAPIAIREFQRIGVRSVFDRARVMLVQSHFVPAKDINSAEQSKMVREFAREQGVMHFEVGNGIEHVLLPERGLVVPGDVVVGADSHTCTYGALGIFATGMGSTDIAVAMATGEIWMKVPTTTKFVYHGVPKPWVGGKDIILHTIGDIGVDGALYQAMEFTGEAIANLSVEGRLTMSNMAIEAGGKVGMCYVDAKTEEYVRGRAQRSYTVYAPDGEAQYESVREYDVSNLEPTVACPNLPSNTKPVSAVSGTRVDQAVIGSCTNGRIEDLRLAAKVLSGRKVDPRVRCIVLPGSEAVYRQALQEGLIQTFVEAGAMFSIATCGPCLGGHMGILAAGEVAISSTNRNFLGRMGSPKSSVYLANPAVVAASAIAGQIASPEDL
jgi:3-isopropylmalate/(R)-2-methylmalate dehydratase large subunit